GYGSLLAALLGGFSLNLDALFEAVIGAQAAGRDTLAGRVDALHSRLVRPSDGVFRAVSGLNHHRLAGFVHRFHDAGNRMNYVFGYCILPGNGCGQNEHASHQYVEPLRTKHLRILLLVSTPSGCRRFPETRELPEPARCFLGARDALFCRILTTTRRFSAWPSFV